MMNYWGYTWSITVTEVIRFPAQKIEVLDEPVEFWLHNQVEGMDTEKKNDDTSTLAPTVGNMCLNMDTSVFHK